MAATIYWAVKGGMGTTVVSACRALARPGSLLIDLDGDLPAVLGAPEPHGQSLVDWFATDLPASAVAELAIDIAAGRLVPRGDRALPLVSDRWAELGRGLGALGADVVVDAGTGTLPEGLIHPAADDVRLVLVTRPCYLALRRATGLTPRPDAIVLVDEPGRQLRRRDVEHVVGAPVVATVNYDPKLARAVDAGLLACRPPHGVRRELVKATA